MILKTTMAPLPLLLTYKNSPEGLISISAAASPVKSNGYMMETKQDTYAWISLNCTQKGGACTALPPWAVHFLNCTAQIFFHAK